MTQKSKTHLLKIKKLPIDTDKLTVVYLHQHNHVYKTQGFQSGERICIKLNNHFIIATLHIINTNWLATDEIGVSEYTYNLLRAQEGEYAELTYSDPLKSLSFIRGKIHDKELNLTMLQTIMRDIVNGQLSNIHIAAFLTACFTRQLTQEEMVLMTEAMVEAGERLEWPKQLTVDKHCVGGLPGNRTTLIVVPIVSAFGLMIPKSSSRAITSAAGTADTMEILAPVNLEPPAIRQVVKQENGCIVWGGKSALSPADDILIAVERELNLDMPGQIISSILSKKIAAGSNHLVIDIPVGPTAKVRSKTEALTLKKLLENTAKRLGLSIKIVITDGSQPIGFGIGPALEARDVVAILKNEKNAPQDLKERALMLAGLILEFSPDVKEGDGYATAQDILNSGKAWKKFQAICQAQGGMRAIPKAHFTQTVLAELDGKISGIDNRRIAHLAKSAGAPYDKAAGVDLHAKIGDTIKKGQPLLTIHAETSGELEYALSYWNMNEDLITFG